MFSMLIERAVPVMVRTELEERGAGAKVRQDGALSDAKWDEMARIAGPVREIVSIVGRVSMPDIKYGEVMQGSSQQLGQCIRLECDAIKEDAISQVYGSVAAFVGGIQGDASGYLSWGSLPVDPNHVNEIRSRIVGVLECSGGKVLSAPLYVHAPERDTLTIAGRFAPRPTPDPIPPKLEVIDGYFDGYRIGQRALFITAPGNVAHFTINYEEARSFESILQISEKVGIRVMVRVACHVRTEFKGGKASYSLQSIEFAGTEDRFSAEDGLPF